MVSNSTPSHSHCEFICMGWLLSGLLYIHERFADPFFFGGYPESMRARVGGRLPKFTADEAALVKGSLDFMGINHYTTHYTMHNNTVSSIAMGLLLDGTMTDAGTVSVRESSPSFLVC